MVPPIRVCRSDQGGVFTVDLPPAVQHVEGVAEAKEVLCQRDLLDPIRTSVLEIQLDALARHQRRFAMRLQVNMGVDVHALGHSSKYVLRCQAQREHARYDEQRGEETD